MTIKRTYWFYFGERLVGAGRGTNEQDAHQSALRAGELIDRDNLPYLRGGLGGNLTSRVYAREG